MFTKFFLRICLLVAIAVNLNYASTFQPTCSLSPLGMTCLQQHATADWTVAAKITAAAGSPLEMLSWSDPELIAWLNKLRQACLPFNAVMGCTESKGGRHWWNCLSDQTIAMAIQFLKSTNLHEWRTGELPEQPHQIRISFNAISRVCDFQTLTNFRQQQHCMGSAINKSSASTFRRQLETTDNLVRSNCSNFTCAAAKRYVHMLVSIVDGGCDTQNADVTVVNLIGSLIRLRMTEVQQLYCNETVFPYNITTYRSGSDIEDPSDALVPIESPNCQPTASTTVASTVTEASTIAPVVTVNSTVGPNVTESSMITSGNSSLPQEATANLSRKNAGLSWWAILLIVVACIFVLGVIVLALVYFARNRLNFRLNYPKISMLNIMNRSESNQIIVEQ